MRVIVINGVHRRREIERPSWSDYHNNGSAT
jgi:hypothetical protein